LVAGLLLIGCGLWTGYAVTQHSHHGMQEQQIPAHHQHR